MCYLPEVKWHGRTDSLLEMYRKEKKLVRGKTPCRVCYLRSVDCRVLTQRERDHSFSEFFDFFFLWDLSWRPLRTPLSFFFFFEGMNTSPLNWCISLCQFDKNDEYRHYRHHWNGILHLPHRFYQFIAHLLLEIKWQVLDKIWKVMHFSIFFSLFLWSHQN